MVTFTQGKTLTAGDLAILMRNAQGALFDPQNLTYSIFQVSKSIPTRPTQAYEYDLHQPQNMEGGPTLPVEGLVLVGQPNCIPRRASMGAYFIPITIPTTWSGVFRLVWYIQSFPGGPIDQRFEDFVVQAIDPADPAFEAPSMIVGKTLSIA
jgi:hypothetical protein